MKKKKQKSGLFDNARKVETGFSFCPCPETISQQHFKKRLCKLEAESEEAASTAVSKGLDPNNLCRISQLCKKPEEWRPLLKTIPNLLQRLKECTQSSYIIGCIESICDNGNEMDLQILGIHALVFIREFYASIEPQCNELTLLACIPYLYKRCLIFSRPIVRGYETFIQKMWLSETLEVLEEQNLNAMISEGVCEEYSEMIARDALFDIGQFNEIRKNDNEWWSGWFITTEALETIESDDGRFCARNILSTISVIEGKILKKLEMLSMRFGFFHQHTHLDMYLWFYEKGMISLSSKNISAADNDQFKIILVGLRKGFKNHVIISKERIASQNNINTTTSNGSGKLSNNFSSDIFYLDQGLMGTIHNNSNSNSLFVPNSKMSYEEELNLELGTIINEMCENYLFSW